MEQNNPKSHLNNWQNPSNNYGSIPQGLISTGDILVEDDSDHGLQESYKNRGSSFSAYFNIMCVVAGSGILGMPYAIQQGGWIIAFFLILLAIMNIYSNIKLIECLYHDNGSRRTSMAQIADDAFGKFGLVLISFLSNSLVLGVPILYLILSGESFQTLFNDNFGINLGVKTWILICAITMCVPFVLFKTVKEASWLGISGVLATLVVVIVVFITSLVDLPNNRDNKHHLINPRNMPIALATIFFSYGGNVVYPRIEAGMKYPNQWPKVLSLATATVTILYLLVCIPAYETYGDKTSSPIYKSLPPGLAVSVLIIFISIHVLSAMPIHQTVFANEIEDYLITKSDESWEFIHRAFVRITIVIVSICIATTVPYFADVMSLLGALGNGTFVTVFPILTWIKLFGWNRLNGWKEKCWVIFSLIFAIFVSVVGTIDAILAIYSDLTSEGGEGGQ